MKTKEIKELYKQCHTPIHVQKHMEVVASVADVIAAKIKSKGHDIDLKKVHDLAMMHDLMKAIVFKDFSLDSFKKRPTKEDLMFWKKMSKKYGSDDIVATSHILEKAGEKWLAKAVISQQFDAAISRSHPLKTLEEKVVYYADKRVAHSTIVTLKERLEEGYRRYKTTSKKPVRTQRAELAIHMLEEEILTMAEDKDLV